MAGLNVGGSQARVRLVLAALFALVVQIAAALPAAGQDEIRTLVNDLAVGGFKETAAGIDALAATGDTRVVPVLEALGEGDLYSQKSDRSVVVAKRGGSGYLLTDPLTGEQVGDVSRYAVEKIRVNNSLRRAIRTALGALTLRSPKRSDRLQAAEAMFKSADPDAIGVLDAALAVEEDATVSAAMAEARAAAVLNGDADLAAKQEAISVLAARGDRDALSVLLPQTEAEDAALATSAREAVAAIERTLAMWEAGQNVWYGLSLGSVLLLAAIGLAITFGVMGVINMAHGEMVMIGAYTTFVVQETIRNHAPELFPYSLTIALPLAFLVSGAVGAAIERGVIRHLYGRPLETLLATWGLSLILQQAVRSLFGPTNREVGTPEWMSGATEVGNLLITYNRFYILLFALFTFALLLLVLRSTSLGLQMRAVTQNRAMAASMGIRTPWTDMMTFALGSGIAGVAGVALSQIDNVSPNLGQSYIIDSFLVVVFGGVGNLWGTLVGAFSLGVINKFLEPYAGAVLGKIFVLVFIILFIQKRPRGLFALKGRAVES